MNQGLKGNYRRDGSGVNTASGSNYWKNPWNPSVLRPFNSLIRDIYIIFRERLLSIKKSIHFVGQHRALMTETRNTSTTTASSISSSRQFVTELDNSQSSLPSSNPNNGSISDATEGRGTNIRCKSPLSSSGDEEEEETDEEGENEKGMVIDLDIDDDDSSSNSMTFHRHSSFRESRRSHSESRLKKLPPGLCNNGNLCFLNSTLQALASVPSFVSTLNRVVGTGDVQTQTSVSAALSSVLQLLNGEEKLEIASLGQSKSMDQSSSPKAVDPSLLANLIRNHQLVTRQKEQTAQSVQAASIFPWSAPVSSTPSSMLGNGSMFQEQQDAQELLQALIQALTEESTNETSSNSSRKTPTLKDMLDGSVTASSSLTQSLSSSQFLSASQSCDKPSVASVLGGWFGTSIECGSCGFKRPIANSPFTSITLSLSDRTESCVDIESCIAALTAPEWLRGVECSQCTIQKQVTELEEKVSFLNDTVSLNRTVEDKEEEEEMKQELETAQSALAVLRGPKAATMGSDGGCLCGQECGSEAECLVTPVRSSICKRLLISRLPSVLILHVNRQSFCPRSGMPTKSRKRVRFGLELDMSSFLSFGGADWRAVAKKENAAQSEVHPPIHPVLVKTKSNSNRMMYDLCAVIEHHGGAVGGHYTTFRKIKAQMQPEGAQGLSSDAWVHASDLNVETTDIHRVMGCEAYLLFYERRSQ